MEEEGKKGKEKGKGKQATIASRSTTPVAKMPYVYISRRTTPGITTPGTTSPRATTPGATTPGATTPRAITPPTTGQQLPTRMIISTRTRPQTSEPSSRERFYSHIRGSRRESGSGREKEKRKVKEKEKDIHSEFGSPEDGWIDVGSN